MRKLILARKYNWESLYDFLRDCEEATYGIFEKYTEEFEGEVRLRIEYIESRNEESSEESEM
jgi:hypothetical protein